MPRRTTRRVALLTGVALLVVAAGAVVGYAVWPRGGEMEQAVSRLPDSTLRVTWTDWAGIREELGAGDVTGPEGDAMLVEAGERDLSSASPTAGQHAQIEEVFGFDPLRSDWELLGQSRKGMVLLFRMPEDVDLGEIGDTAEEIGYDRPGEDALSGGVWTGGADVLAATGLTAGELQHLAFLEDERLLLASDDAGYLEDAVPFAQGEEDGLDVSELTAELDDPLAAVALASDYACEALAMTAADEGAQATAEELVEAAGGVSPLTGYLVALGSDGRMTVALDFESDDQAEADARSRPELAVAEDPGQMVAYPDVFEVRDARAEGSSVVIVAEPGEGAYPLSNLTQGPVLLAAC